MISDGALCVFAVLRGPLPVFHRLRRRRRRQRQLQPEPVRRLPERHFVRRRRLARGVHVPRGDQRAAEQDSLLAQGLSHSNFQAMFISIHD